MMDLYTEITSRIIEQLEKGIIPWNKPWTGVNTGAISHSTGRAYSLINQLILNRPGEYITFNQCKKEGGSVKKGSKAKMIVFWKVLPREKTDSSGNIVIDKDGNAVIVGMPILRYFQVFHISDCIGVSEKWNNGPSAAVQPIEAAERMLLDYVKREGITFESVKSNKAFYAPSLDLIHIPSLDQYEHVEQYYGTAFHEAAHSTGSPKRLNRFSLESGAAAFGSDSYSREELVAEIASACIINVLGLETEKTFKNSAAYIQSWLRALKNDKRLIVSAAARAEKAVKLIQNNSEPEYDSEAE